MSDRYISVTVDHGAYSFSLSTDNDTVRQTLSAEAVKLGATTDDDPTEGMDRITQMMMPLDHPAEVKQFVEFCATQGWPVDDDIEEQISIPDFAALRNTSNQAHGGQVTQQMIGSMMRTINNIAVCYQARENLGFK